MRDKHTRKVAIQWMIPTAILLIAIVAMFVDFFKTSSKSAQVQVERNF